MNDTLIVREGGNNRRVMRVMRWLLDKPSTVEEVIIPNIYSLGLMMDDEGSLFVSDWERHEVRRYRSRDGEDGVVVAGGNSPGVVFNQLNYPQNIYIDADQSVYVSDRDNHRLTRWLQDAEKSQVIVGGNAQGSQNNQFDELASALFDVHRNIYVADYENHRIQRFDLQFISQMNPSDKSNFDQKDETIVNHLPKKEKSSILGRFFT